MVRKPSENHLLTPNPKIQGGWLEREFPNRKYEEAEASESAETKAEKANSGAFKPHHAFQGPIKSRFSLRDFFL